MLSDMIDDLVRADCPQEKEAAYRQLEKLITCVYSLASELRVEKFGRPTVSELAAQESEEHPMRFHDITIL